MIEEFDGRYGFLSNFFPCKVEYEGMTYPSAEHAYQAAKSRHRGVRECIAKMQNPARARNFGKTITLRDGWEKMKLKVMETIIHEKFRTPNLRTALVNTFPEELVEGNWWGDTFWGVCKGRGHNHLGLILMSERGRIIHDYEETERTRMSQEP